MRRGHPRNVGVGELARERRLEPGIVGFCKNAAKERIRQRIHRQGRRLHILVDDHVVHDLADGRKPFAFDNRHDMFADAASRIPIQRQYQRQSGSVYIPECREIHISLPALGRLQQRMVQCRIKEPFRPFFRKTYTHTTNPIRPRSTCFGEHSVESLAGSSSGASYGFIFPGQRKSRERLRLTVLERNVYASVSA